MLTSCSFLLSLTFWPTVDKAFTDLLACDIFQDLSTCKSVFQYCFNMVHWSSLMWIRHVVWLSWYWFFKRECSDFMNLFTAFQNPCTVHSYPMYSNSQTSWFLSSAWASGDCFFHNMTLMSSVQGTLVLTTASQELLSSHPPAMSPPAFTRSMWGFWPTLLFPYTALSKILRLCLRLPLATLSRVNWACMGASTIGTGCMYWGLGTIHLLPCCGIHGSPWGAIQLPLGGTQLGGWESHTLGYPLEPRCIGGKASYIPTVRCIEAFLIFSCGSE